MALRSNHYDAAFEEFLRDLRTPYVAVDEKRRALLEQASLKSMDFIVYSHRSPNLLVDVKGRRCPASGPRRHRLETWATEDDIRSLLHWEQVFGQGFRSLLVFAYDVPASRSGQASGDSYAFRSRNYAFYGIWADEYRTAMRTRSTSWETVWLPSQDYRRLRSPISAFL